MQREHIQEIRTSSSSSSSSALGSPEVGRKPQHAFSKSACHVLSSALASLQYLPRSSLRRSAGLPWHIFLSYGLQVVTRGVHRSSSRRLICPAQGHFILLTVLIISMTVVLSLTQMFVILSLYVMLSILLSILVCAAPSLFCACLVSVQVSAPYVVAGSTQQSLQAVEPVSSGRWQG